MSSSKNIHTGGSMAKRSAGPARLETDRTVRKPILWMALFGAVALAVIVGSVVQWVSSPEFRPVPYGSDPMPAGMQTWITALEVFFTGGALVMWWTYLIRPWVRTGHITWDGIFLLACCTIWYQDPLDNYFNFTFTYNGHFLNEASWSNFIPGWQSPRAGNFGEPYLFMGSFFMWVFFIISVFSCWLLKQFEGWLPRLNLFWRFVIIFSMVALFDFAMEALFTHTGIFAYVAVYKPLSLWAGTASQFPLYESTGIAAVATGLTILRYFRDDQGQSFVEKGVQKLAVPPPARRFLSFLALVGAIQLIVLVGFEGDYQWFAINANSAAKYPSYQMLDICGKGTLYACPANDAAMEPHVTQ